jgi:uncharacterized membrane protein
MIKFLAQERQQSLEDELNKQLNIQYAHIFKLTEEVREMNQKIEKIIAELEEIKQKLDKASISPEEVHLATKKDKTKEAIKIILRKKGRMTSEELCQIIGLSRTRCNEYLKEMERDNEAVSEVINRKKYYKLV